MLLIELTVNGSVRYVSVEGHALTHNWQPYVAAFDAPQIGIPKYHGGYAKMQFGTITFKPDLFYNATYSWTDYPPPVSCAITIAYTDTDEASAETIFTGTAHLSNYDREQVTYALHGPEYDDKIQIMGVPPLEVGRLYEIVNYVAGDDFTNVGISNICVNGADWTGASGATPPTGWGIVIAGTFTISAGGQAGNCLTIAHNGVNHNPEMTWAFATTVGKEYHIRWYAQKGTASALSAKIGTAAGESQLFSGSYTDTDWNTPKAHLFIATSPVTFFSIGAVTSTGSQYAIVDTVTISEATGAVFTATGTTPTHWEHFSKLAPRWNGSLNSVITDILTQIPEITTVNTDAARLVSPNVTWTLVSDTIAINLAGAIAEFYSHLIYVIGSTAYLVDMLRDNGTRTLTEFQFFAFPRYKYKTPYAMIECSYGGVVYNATSSYPYGPTTSVDPYHQTAANIEAALDDILTIENSPRTSFDIPMIAGNFPALGEKITLPDTAHVAAITSWIRVRRLKFDFLKDTINIEGEGAIAAA